MTRRGAGASGRRSAGEADESGTERVGRPLWAATSAPLCEFLVPEERRALFVPSCLVPSVSGLFGSQLVPSSHELVEG